MDRAGEPELGVLLHRGAGVGAAEILLSGLGGHTGMSKIDAHARLKAQRAADDWTDLLPHRSEVSYGAERGPQPRHN